MWLMYKEIVTNAAKHSGAKHVSITLRISSDHLADLVVKDDGRGFDPDASTNGNGLKNIRSRADSIGATAAVTSTPGGGTAWTVRFPV